MGKQINYWMAYEDFQQLARTALDCGCVIIKRTADGKLIHGQTTDIVTDDVQRYWFYVSDCDESDSLRLLLDEGKIGGYNASGNVMIEAGYTRREVGKRTLERERLFVISGYYDENGRYIERPEGVTKVYNKLVRAVKKLAPYTELTDTIYKTVDGAVQPREWKHREYLSPSFLKLILNEHYELRP